MEKLISSLFAGYWGKVPDRIELLPASGSARKYYRIWLGAQTYIGAYHKDRVENRLFLDSRLIFERKDYMSLKYMWFQPMDWFIFKKIWGIRCC